MRKIRTPLITTMAIALLASSAVGVTAQTEEAVVVAPVGFSGSLDWISCDFSSATSEYVGDVEQERSISCDHSAATTDPRFTGVLTTFTNSDSYGERGSAADGFENVSTVVRQLRNDAGTWQGDPVTEVSFDENDDETTTVTVVFTGEGVFAKQTAVVEFAGGAYPKALRGVIFAGPPPPPFDPASVE